MYIREDVIRSIRTMVKNIATPHYKTSWYDGWFYSKILDNNSGNSYKDFIINRLGKNDTVIEIGSGTGFLASEISPYCKTFTGVDSSPKMIGFAEKMKLEKGLENVSFQLVERSQKLSQSVETKFDCALVKMVLHENNPSARKEIIDGIKEISTCAIIADWVYPLPGGFTGLLSNAIEFVAGREHYRNFREWCSIGGLDGFLNMHDLKVIDEKYYANNTGKIVVVTW